MHVRSFIRIVFHEDVGSQIERVHGACIFGAKQSILQVL